MSTTSGSPSTQTDRRTPSAPTPLWRIGWWLLLVLTGLLMLNHLGGTFYIATSNDERQMFELFALVQLLALVILLIPYRRREWWAWLASWIPIVPMALVPVFSQDALSAAYGIVAAVMAVAQFLTLPGFLAVRRA